MYQVKGPRLSDASRVLGSAYHMRLRRATGPQGPCDTRSLAAAHKRKHHLKIGVLRPGSRGRLPLRARAPPGPLAPCGGSSRPRGFCGGSLVAVGRARRAPFRPLRGPCGPLGPRSPRRLIAFPPGARRGCRPLLGVPWSLGPGVSPLRAPCSVALAIFPPAPVPIFRARPPQTGGLPGCPPSRGFCVRGRSGVFGGGPPIPGGAGAACRPPVYAPRPPGINYFSCCARIFSPAAPPPLPPPLGARGERVADFISLSDFTPLFPARPG